MLTLTRWVLTHKRIVAGLWLAITIAAFAAVGPAGQAEARQAQAALRGVEVAGSPVHVTGLDALRASAGESHGSGAGALIEMLLGGLGALLVLALVFRSLVAFVPLLMAAVAIPTT